MTEHGSYTMHYWHFVRRIYQWIPFNHKGPVMQSFDFSFDVSLNKLLDKWLSYRWLKLPWCSCDMTVMLPHWGQVTHICVNNLTIIGSDNGLSPGWRQAIIWTNAGILLIGPIGTNFSEISMEVQTFSLKKMRFGSVVCEMAAILSGPQWVKLTKVIWYLAFPGKLRVPVLTI